MVLFVAKTENRVCLSDTEMVGIFPATSGSLGTEFGSNNKSAKVNLSKLMLGDNNIDFSLAIEADLQMACQVER